MAVYLALPNVLFRPTLEALAEAGLPREHHDRRREALRYRPRRRQGPQRADRAVVRRAPRLPHRPLPGQADHPGHPGLAVRQPDLRSGVEQQPHQPGRHHLVRVAGAGGPGELLRPRGRAARHDPEPSAADAGPHRHGAPAHDHRARPARPQGRGPPRDRAPAAARRCATATRRARYGAGTVAGRQLPAYADEEGVDPARGTETYAEVTFRISNWRWAGTPFRLRTGKAIDKERREIAVHFKSVPHEPFDDRDRPNVLRFQLSPDAISLRLNLNAEGDPFDLEQVTPRRRVPHPGPAALQPAAEGDPGRRPDPVHPRRRGRGAVADRRAGAAAWADDEVPLEEYPGGSAARCGARVPEQPAAGPREPKAGKAAGDDPRSG